LLPGPLLLRRQEARGAKSKEQRAKSKEQGAKSRAQGGERWDATG